MANKKNNRLSARRSSKKSSDPFSLLGVSDVKRSSSRAVSFSGDLKKFSEFSRASATSIAFGKPSNSSGTTKTSSSTSNWTNLLAKSASKNLTNVLGKGLLSFGASSLLSGFSDLFRSAKPALEPLKLFTLADSQDRTVYSNSGGLSNSQVERLSTSVPSTGIYNSSENSTRNLTSTASKTDQYSPDSTSTQSLSHSAIVSAVKQALLTSSSLNDIIGEL